MSDRQPSPFLPRLLSALVLLGLLLGAGYCALTYDDPRPADWERPDER